jgi:hypothetical protein
MPAKKTKKWVAKVKTDSTHPSEGLFNESASVIANRLHRKRCSPKVRFLACGCSLISLIAAGKDCRPIAVPN